MSPSKAQFPTYAAIIADRLRSATEPLPVADLGEQMLAAHPSPAKNPRQAMRQHLRQAVGRSLVFLDPDTILPMRLACQGARFRLPLDRDSVLTGLVPLGDIVLGSYLPMGFGLDQVRLIDAAGQPIAFQTQQKSETLKTPLGRTTVETLYANLGAWFRAQNVKAKDQLLVTVVDWEHGVVQLQREAFNQYDPARHAERNRVLADLFYDLLESAVTETIFVHEAVPTAYARLPDKGGYPPGHWLAVVADDERLDTDGWQIKYPGRTSFLDFLISDWEGEPRPDLSQPVSKKQAELVYTFKAVLADQPKLWRTVEIQGKQSLVDLDGAMRGAFNHDTWDHLGGFWKLVPRGGTAKPGSKPKSAPRPPRYREVDLGDVDPEGGGTGAEVMIAELGLAVGDQLKYVYDFGDWIEHRLTVESIGPPQKRIKYPREVGRNEPQYAYCVECQQQGRQTVAKWICVECSDQRSQDILLCETCAEKGHDEHYIEEILY